MIDVKNCSRGELVQAYYDALDCTQRVIDAHNQTRAELVAERGALYDMKNELNALVEWCEYDGDILEAGGTGLRERLNLAHARLGDKCMGGM